MSHQEHQLDAPIFCHKCGHKWDTQTALDDKGNPRDGDINVCIGCGEAFEFHGGTVVKLSEEAFKALARENQAKVRLAQAMIVGRNKAGTPEGYNAQMKVMMYRARCWRWANPHKAVKIQFNVPSQVFVIQSIGEALKYHIVVTNGEGKDLIDYMISPFPDAAEPTVAMVRAALEATL